MPTPISITDFMGSKIYHMQPFLADGTSDFTSNYSSSFGRIIQGTRWRCVGAMILGSSLGGGIGDHYIKKSMLLSIGEVP